MITLNNNPLNHNNNNHNIIILIIQIMKIHQLFYNSKHHK